MNRKLRLAACFVAMLLPLVAIELIAQEPPGKVAELEQLAQKYLHEQKPAQAIPIFRQILALDPQNRNAHANLGVLLFFDGKYKDAAPELQAALQTQPDLWRIEALLGIAEKRTGQEDAARHHLEEAFAQIDDKKIRLEAGLELLELDAGSQQFGKALLVGQELEQLAPQNRQVLFAMYQLASQLMDQSLLSMMMVGADSAEMHMIMADALARQGDEKSAIAQYRQAIRMDPKLPGAHYQLAVQLEKSPDPAMNAEAEAEFRNALQTNEFDERSWKELGQIVLRRNDFRAAEADFRKALALQPRDADAETGLAIAMISTNRNKEAIALLESAIKDDPTNAIAHYRLSIQYRRVGKASEADQEMKIFLRYKNMKDTLSKVYKDMAVQTTPQ